MNDLIQRLVDAIFRQEGMGPDHANPGNLRDCPWFPVVAIIEGDNARRIRRYPTGESVQFAGGFWVPRSRAEGIAGAAHVVALHIAQGNSLAQLISIWAPATENDTAAYIANVKRWAGIPDEKLPLWNYIMESERPAPQPLAA
jgi:hypothetical protein